MFHQLKTDVERHYMKALLDPFHPQALGARVPMLLPRQSVCYSTYKELQIPNNTDMLVFTNLELGA